MQWFCSIDWFVPTRMFKPHFTSAVIRHIPRATYIPSEQFKQLLLNLRHWAYKVFRLFPLLTSNDLWTSWKIIGFIYSLRGTYIPSLKFMQCLLLEIPCLQDFDTFTAVYLQWPLTTMKTNRDHLLTKGYLPIKFEILSLQSFQTLISVDHKWSLTIHDKQ